MHISIKEGHPTSSIKSNPIAQPLYYTSHHSAFNLESENTFGSFKNTANSFKSSYFNPVRRIWMVFKLISERGIGNGLMVQPVGIQPSDRRRFPYQQSYHIIITYILCFRQPQRQYITYLYKTSSKCRSKVVLQL